MPGKSELFEQLLSEKLWHTCDTHTRPADLFVSLEGGLVRTVKNEEWVDVVCEEAEKAVVKSAKRRVRAAFASLNLEEPDGDVDGETEWAIVKDVVVGSEFGERNALSWAELFEDATQKCQSSLRLAVAM
jgi:hypothetical protein